jgi:hypothetical protein
MKLRHISFAVSAFASVTSFATPTFKILTPPAGATPSFEATGLSRDGSSVIAQGSVGTFGGSVVWNKSGTFELPHLMADGISGDGTKVCGRSSINETVFYWNGSLSSIDIGPYGGVLFHMSANGAYSVGTQVVYDSTAPSKENEFAIRLLLGSSGWQLLPQLQKYRFEEADACSADGTVAVGVSAASDIGDHDLPVYWDGAGVHQIPLLAGQTVGYAECINDAGNVILVNEGTALAFYANGTLHKFADLANAWMDRLHNAMSNDANVVVTVSNGKSVVWTPAGGLQDPTTFLHAHGVNTGTYTIRWLESVSGDGTTYCGWCTPPNSSYESIFVATIDPVAPAPTTFTPSASAVVGGSTINGTVGFAAATAGPFNLVVSGTANSASSLVAVPKGVTSITFPIVTSGVAATTTETLSASVGKTSLTKSLILMPATLTSIGFQLPSIIGGNGQFGSLHLNGNSPSVAETATVTSSSTNATVPAVQSLAFNSSAPTFPILTKGVAASQQITITATYKGVTKSAILTVVPAALYSANANVVSVKGGTTDIFKLYLNGNGPAAGAILTLKSTNPAVASVPATATVASGQRGIYVVITTHAVSKATAVTLSATYAGITKSCILTVDP